MPKIALRNVILVSIALGISAVIPILAQQAGDALQPISRPEVEQALKKPEMRFNATIGSNAPPSADVIDLGHKIVAQGSRQSGGATACVTCHGANGEGNAEIGSPRISLMPAWYLYKQLNDYANETRPNPVMTGIAQQLDDGEKRAVSSYYSILFKEGNAVVPPQDQLASDRGKPLYMFGQLDRAIPACANCHGGQGGGIPPSVPYLVGQHPEYIQAQLKSWQQNLRKNDAHRVMGIIASKMTAEDIAAVSAYLAAQKTVTDLNSLKPVQNASGPKP